MKLSEVKPCASCGGPLREGMIANWYVFRASIAMVNPRAAQEVAGLTQYFNGALGFAELFAPRSEDAIMIAGEKDPKLYTEAHVCMDCASRKSLCELMEAVNREPITEGVA